jgi:hypothetical protein
MSAERPECWSQKKLSNAQYWLSKHISWQWRINRPIEELSETVLKLYKEDSVRVKGQRVVRW